MNQKQYRLITNKIREYKYGVRLARFINRFLTEIVYVAFFALLIFMVIQTDKNIVRVVVVTGISFVLVSVVRHFINAKRPYTMYDFVPIIEKDKEGDSMPSRHVFSAFVIAMAFLYVNTCLGVFFLIIALLMAIERVIVGVHFPKDVIVGAIIGVVSGVIGFYII